MMMRWKALAVCLLLLAGTAFLPVASAGSTYLITASGTSFRAGGSPPIFLDGVNDQTVVPYALYPYPAYDYRYSNHLFSSSGDGYIGDVLTKITSTNYTDFWWQYFSCIKALGLNHVRLGGFDEWGLSLLHSTWENNQTLWRSVIDPMFDMANETGIYLTFCFGLGYWGDITFDSMTKTAGHSGSLGNPMAGNVYQLDSAAYNELVSFIGEVTTRYSNQTCVAMWELANEPDGDLTYARYWATLPAPRASYQAWASSLIDDVAAIDHTHLLTIGAQGYGNYWGWGESEFDAQQDIGADATHIHLYSGTNSDLGSYWISQRQDWSENLGLPIYVGEYGWGAGGINYYDWCHDGMMTYGYAGCAMLAMWGYPGYPIDAGGMAGIPAIPASYWSNRSVMITPTPVEVPNVPDSLPDPHINTTVGGDTIAASNGTNATFDFSGIGNMLLVLIPLALLAVIADMAVTSRRR
jgi:hypothetical protein